jgi:hypothetical protein
MTLSNEAEAQTTKRMSIVDNCLATFTDVVNGLTTLVCPPKNLSPRLSNFFNLSLKEDENKLTCISLAYLYSATNIQEVSSDTPSNTLKY